MVLGILGSKAKLEDVVAALNGLVPNLEALETLQAGFEERLAVVEQFMAEHQAGAARRQREIDRLRSENQRLRWEQQGRRST